MKIKKGKKGVTHVEIIISFVIFISFLIFMFIMFKPLKIFSKSTTDLDITKIKIIDYVSTNLSIFSLKINSSAYESVMKDWKECFNADFNNSLINGKLIMKDESGEIINATIQNNNLYFNNFGMFYKLYSSEEFEEKESTILNCYGLDKSNYTLGVERTYKKISYLKLNDFFEDYTQNYTQLKNNLDLKNDFNIFILDYSGGVMNNFKAERYKPKSIEITATNTPIEILDENATLNPAVMNIQVWK